jgi:type IV pilus assembly protein PilY1
MDYRLLAEMAVDRHAAPVRRTPVARGKRALRRCLRAAGLLLAFLHYGAWAQMVIQDDFTGASSRYDWKALNGACLTAGNNTGNVPACMGLSYYGSSVQVGGTSGRLPDAPGSGALRLTNGDQYLSMYELQQRGLPTSPAGTNSLFQSGAIVSNFTFPTSQGTHVTFTTYTYGGNGEFVHGADGLSFFLSDGSLPPNVGAVGGSLGYTCKNNLVTYDPTTGTYGAVAGNPRDVPDAYDGMNGGYLGLGIDEYGNFANPEDNTDTGLPLKPGRIALRGAGDTRWSTLQKKYPLYYPASLAIATQAEAVRKACSTGTAWNYSGTSLVDATGAIVPDRGMTNERLAFNYPYLASSDLPASVTIENQEGVDQPKRGVATPFTYDLSISQDGLFSLFYSVAGGTPQPVMVNKRITDSNGPLPSSFRFGFAGSTGGGTNVHEMSCFRVAPLNTASTSAATNLQPAARVRAGSQVYMAFNHPLNWWGQLTAQDLLEDTTTGNLTLSATANWDASCTLTGGPCTALGAGAPNVSAQAPNQRSILTWSGAAGVPFRWGSLTAAQQAALTSGDASATADRLNYLRGDRSKEIAGGGSFRTRSGVLGDMLDASPTWVGAPSSPYDGPWDDKLTHATAAENSGASYASFRSLYATRQNLVYAGANDGLMHAFRAGAMDASGKFAPSASTPNDGREALAYMPADVLSAIHSATPALDFSGSQYAHNLYTDGTPGIGDLRYGGAWHTWLVAGLGPARNALGPVNTPGTAVSGTVYALDITDPAQFGESNAATIVKGEWNSSTISCTNVAGCGSHLGAVAGAPAIRRLHNGSWAALFGNGLNSASGTAGLFIMLVDPASGTVTFRYLDTGAGGANGIVNVAPADLDGDHITDYVYAGDALGNLWRFDLTAADPSLWGASAAPLFQADAGQPITARPTIASVPGKGEGALPRVVVSFGTGQQLPQSLTGAAVYPSARQALYGVWDANFDAWNAKNTSGVRFASLAAPGTVQSPQLLAQSVTGTSSAGTVDARTVSQLTVCWSGSTECGSGNNRMGWMLPLPGGSEQVLYNPVLSFGMFLVNTTIPEVDNPLTCGRQPPTGYTMAVSVSSGGAAKVPFFPDATSPQAAGLALSATGSPSVVTTRTKAFLVQQTVSGRGAVTLINPAPAGAGGRLNWIQLR